MDTGNDTSSKLRTSKSGDYDDSSYVHTGPIGAPDTKVTGPSRKH